MFSLQTLPRAAWRAGGNPAGLLPAVHREPATPT